MYKYYAISFPYHELYVNYTKTFQNKYLHSFHNSIVYKFTFIQQFLFIKMKVFPKVTNTHLYINQKKTKKIKF